MCIARNFPTHECEWDREHEGNSDEDCFICTVCREHCVSKWGVCNCSICNHYRENRPNCNCDICTLYESFVTDRCACIICERYLRHCDREHEGFWGPECDRCAFYLENCLDRHTLDDCEICSHYSEHLERDPPCNCALCVYYRTWIDV